MCGTCLTTPDVQMTTIDKQLKDLVDAGAMIVVPQVPVPIGIGYVRVIDKTVRWSVPYPDNQSDVHEFNFSEVEIKGPHIIFTTDRGKVYVSAVDEWVPEQANKHQHCDGLRVDDRYCV